MLGASIKKEHIWDTIMQQRLQYQEMNPLWGWWCRFWVQDHRRGWHLSTFSIALNGLLFSLAEWGLHLGCGMIGHDMPGLWQWISDWLPWHWVVASALYLSTRRLRGCTTDFLTNHNWPQCTLQLTVWVLHHWVQGNERHQADVLFWFFFSLRAVFEGIISAFNTVREGIFSLSQRSDYLLQIYMGRSHVT